MSQPDQITISSYNAPENQRASDFESTLGNTVIYPKKICLTKFTMPNWIYDISPQYNKIGIKVKNTTTTTTYSATASIDTGTHWTSGALFATYLSTLISSALTTAGCPQANVITVTFNVATGKLTITAFTGYTLTLQSWENPDPVTSASALYKMGFTNTFGNYYNGTFGASITGDSNLNLLGTSVIYIACSLLGNAQNDKRGLDGTIVGDESIFCNVPVNANFGELIIYQDSFGHFIDSNVNSIRSIRVSLLNEEYNVITLPRGCYATLEFRLQY
jgi:hypothetical protein